jgi:hypothetical protein
MGAPRADVGDGYVDVTAVEIREVEGPLLPAVGRTAGGVPLTGGAGSDAGALCAALIYEHAVREMREAVVPAVELHLRAVLQDGR